MSFVKLEITDLSPAEPIILRPKPGSPLGESQELTLSARIVEITPARLDVVVAVRIRFLKIYRFSENGEAEIRRTFKGAKLEEVLKIRFKIKEIKGEHGTQLPLHVESFEEGDNAGQVVGITFEIQKEQNANSLLAGKR